MLSYGCPRNGSACVESILASGVPYSRVHHMLSQLRSSISLTLQRKLSGQGSLPTDSPCLCKAHKVGNRNWVYGIHRSQVGAGQCGCESLNGPRGGGLPVPGVCRRPRETQSPTMWEERTGFHQIRTLGNGYFNLEERTRWDSGYESLWKAG